MSFEQTITLIRTDLTSDSMILVAGAIMLAIQGLVYLSSLFVEAPAPARLEHTSDRDNNKSNKNAVEDDLKRKHNRKESESNWRERLQLGLSKTRSSLRKSISEVLANNKIDANTLEKLQEILFRADIGIVTTDKLISRVKQTLIGKSASWPEVQNELHRAGKDILSDFRQKDPEHTDGPKVILVVGVNGVGKTTTIGKLASHYVSQDKSVLLCAADTYRAAAIDQLRIWGERIGVKVIAHQANSDPAAVAYDGAKAAIARKSDILLIDTAGRLHNKADLMKELDKIKRVLGKDLPGAPHETLLVIDSTTGQNAFAQVKAFSAVVAVTGLVVTKLDGTAKGGVVLGLWDQFRLPIKFLGVGEGVNDLKPFTSSEFLDSLFPRELETQQ